MTSSLQFSPFVLGFYYFVFSNENEITNNFVAAHFDLHKTVFDVREPERSCLNTTDCSLDLAFFSEQHVVIEVGDSSLIIDKVKMTSNYFRFLKVMAGHVTTRLRV